MKKRVHLDAEGKRVRIGGKGPLTKEHMLQLQKDYGKAISSNVGDPVKMKRTVMASFYHSMSTDDNPLHMMCPSGVTSWCRHKWAEVKTEPSPSHHPIIHPDSPLFVKPVYLELSKDSLMVCCVLGATKNQNESFNSLIWNRCPKTEFCSADIVEIATNLAVITFNSGQGVLKGLL